MTARALTTTSIITTFIIGLAVAGCSDSKSGRIVTPGSGTTTNMKVINRDNDTIHVFVDGGEIGTVLPNQTIDFAVIAGLRVVSFRETGDNTPDVQGEFVFNTTQIIQLTHDPSITVNFRVRNTGLKTIDVFVDLDDKGDVQPGQTRDWKLTSGIRDVHIRERGESTADYIGTFNINTSGITTVTFP